MAKKRTKARIVAKPQPDTEPQPLDVRLLPIDQIKRSPHNPRDDFPADELAELAASIRQQGILQPVVVRLIDAERFELVAGERRYRAAQAAGLAEIPASVRVLSDAQARQITLTENLQRRDLSAVEEARGIGALLDTSDLTQEQLAERLGKSQPWIANRLRLLKLPESIQGRIISGEIPPTHARCLVKYADCPAVMAEVERRIDHDQLTGVALPTIEEWADDVVDAAWQQTRPLEGEAWDAARGARVPVFAPTDEQREELAIVEIEDGDAPVERATNVELWDRLQEEHAAAWEANGGKTARKGTKAADAAKEKEPTPAEKRKLAAEKRAEFDKRLHGFRVRWYRYLLGRWYLDEATESDLLRLLLLVDTAWLRGYQWDRSARMAEILKSHGEPVKGGREGRDLVGPVLACELIEEVGREFCGAIFYTDADGPNEHIVPDEDVERLVVHHGIDLVEAWLEEQCGPLSRAYWHLHTREQLAGLATELGQTIPAEAKTKGQIVEWFVSLVPAEDSIEVGIEMPKELLPGKKKGGRKGK